MLWVSNTEFPPYETTKWRRDKAVSFKKRVFSYDFWHFEQLQLGQGFMCMHAGSRGKNNRSHSKGEFEMSVIDFWTSCWCPSEVLMETRRSRPRPAPSSYRAKVRRANCYTTAPPRHAKKETSDFQVVNILVAWGHLYRLSLYGWTDPWWKGAFWLVPGAVRTANMDRPRTDFIHFCFEKIFWRKLFGVR